MKLGKLMDSAKYVAGFHTNTISLIKSQHSWVVLQPIYYVS